ncbi:MAG: flagellar hook-associated protein FlgL [Limnochordales bacterium]
MRVTNNMIARNAVNNLNLHLRRQEELHYQLASGKRLRVPSDDPAATSHSMRLHSDLTHTKQYRANIGVALSWLEATDSVLNEVGQALQRVKELAVYGANGVLPQDARDAIAREVDQILEHLVDLANSSHAGLYLFGGHRTTTPPYVLSDGTVSYQGDTGRRELEIASGVKIAVNVLGSELFDQIFQAVTNLRDALYAGDTATVGNQSLAEVEDALDTLLRVRADVGARINRLELADARMQELELNVEQLISDNEDVDLARAIIDLKVAENVYRAALASGARIIQPTLLDFLR